MEHSLTTATGTGWEPTPWHATQRAAWEALRKVEDGRGPASTTNAGRDAHVRVKKVGQREVTEIRSWDAHERIAVKRT